MTEKKEPKAQFAALPIRAIGDNDLTSQELRTLAVIAYHDRLSAARGKGQGAWASNKKMAERVGCHYTRISSAITKLAKAGYITREKHHFNKRMNVYRVVYETTDSLQAGKLSSDDATPAIPPFVSEPANDDQTTVCSDLENAQSNQSHNDDEYISLSEVIDCSKEPKDIPLSGADFSNPRRLGNGSAWERQAPINPETAPSANIGSLLSRFERDLKHGCTELDYQAWHDWLWIVMDGHSDETEGKHAERLLTEYDWPDSVQEKY